MDSCNKAQIVAKLEDAGYKKSEIEECDGNIILEGDHLIPKESIASILNASNDAVGNAAEDRQFVYQSSNVIDYVNTISINYFKDPSVSNIGGANFTGLIDLALSRWSQANTGIRVSFTPVTSNANADLTFFRDNAGAGLVPAPPTCMLSLGSGTLGFAMIPVSGNCGRYISLSSTTTFANNNARVATLVHEIGHVLGYWHDNVPTSNITDCSLTGISAFLMPGTPQSDGASVMVTPLNTSNTTPSTKDILTGRFLYPPSYTTPSITSVGLRPGYSSTMQVKINPVSPFYYKAIVEVSALNGTILQTIHMPGMNSNGTANFTYFFNRPTPTATYRVRVRGRNYQDDFQSAWSPYTNFTI